jgi:hypothetical protein
MKMLHYSRWHSVLVIIAGMTALSACVNEEYDLSKDIDTEITILKNVSMPLGSIEPVTIEKILNLEQEDISVLCKNDDGDFIFTFTGSEISAEIDVPSFSIAPAGGMQTEPIEVHFNTGPAAGMDPGIVTENIVYSKVTGKLLDASMDIEVDSKLPSQIVDVKSVSLDASIYMNFSVNAGAVHLIKGFSVEFPEFLNVVGTGYTDSRFEIQSGNKLVVKDDILISSVSPLTFALKVDKITLPQGSISDGLLVMNDEVRVNGDFYLSPSDFRVIPEELVVDIKADMTDLDVLSAEVKLAINEKVNGTSLSISEFPEFLTGGNVCLDLYNPSLNFGVKNHTPFAFGVKAGIKAARGNDSVEIQLGEDPAIDIPADTEAFYQITRKETDVPQGAVNIVVPELGDLISILPEKVTFDDITLTSTSTDYVSIVSGDKYSASISYEVYAPLAFDKDLNIEFSTDINEIGLSFDEFSVESFKLGLKIENSIPLDFAIDAVVLDAEGSVVNDMELNVSAPVKGGTQNSPAVSDIEISIKSTGDSFSLDGLRLTMNASAPSDLTGVALNEKQGFKITNLVITCPEGVTFNNSEK